MHVFWIGIHHMGDIYCMANLCTKQVVMSHDVIWLKKTYGKYEVCLEQTKADRHLLKCDDDENTWFHIKINPDKT